MSRTRGHSILSLPFPPTSCLSHPLPGSVKGQNKSRQKWRFTHPPPIYQAPKLLLPKDEEVSKVQKPFEETEQAGNQGESCPTDAACSPPGTEEELAKEKAPLPLTLLGDATPLHWAFQIFVPALGGVWSAGKGRIGHGLLAWR